MTSTQVTSSVDSGDVALFVRKFGAPGKTPLLILHGGNYFDSADWIDVAEQLASDREAAAFDSRGFGNSGWSASKDYSYATVLRDIRAVLGHLGWAQAIIVGHSRGGALALLAAARAPEIAAGLVCVDYNPVHGFAPPGGVVPQTGLPTPIVPTIEAGLDMMTRYSPRPLTPEMRARAEQFLTPVDGGFQLTKRDPHFLTQPSDETAGTGAQIKPRGGLEELEDTRCPVLVVRAQRSPGFKPEDLPRLASIDRIDVREVDSGHDVIGEVPAQFMAVLSDWLKGTEGTARPR